MNSTRQPPPIQVFADPISSPTSLGTTEKPRPQLQPSAMPLQPVHNLPNHPEIILTAPPSSHPQQMSPLKSHPMSPPKPNYNNLSYVNIPPPSTTHMYTDSPMKRPMHPTLQQIRPQPMIQQPLFTTFNSNFDAFEQENYHSSALIHDNFVDFPDPSYARKQTLKRSFSDVVPMGERPFKKMRGDDENSTHVPEPEDMPPIEDDGNKPSYSYAQMIGMAILRASNRRLTLAQIYDWISSTFAYYREDTKQGWHNSIRHNLSLNKAFKKQERPKGDAGKGSYWVIEPGMEVMFVKDKNRKGNSISHITMHANVMRPDVPSLPQPPLEPLTLTPFLVQQTEPLARPQTAPALPELSSDATLPASDPALAEDDIAVFEPNNLPQPRSSPPDAINSSPPMAVSAHRRSGSSPNERARQPSSILRHKRHATTMDDSGYFSSIESSVLRPNKSNIILTSELDIEPARKKQRGRAEEEIQRIRSSSHDVTPSHNRFRSSTAAVADGQLSSPIRPSPAVRKNPVTPSIVFKKPARPPPSVSPNTQLHMHRRAMQEFANSPVKSYGLWPNDVDAWSPLKWSSAQYHAPQDEFEIFSDPVTGMTPATPGYGSSPAKASIKRANMARTHTTASVLSEVMGNGHRVNTKTPSKSNFLKPAPYAVLSGSPLKGSMTNISILDEQDDLFDFGSFENENSDNDEGLDISKGFGKIGGNASHQNLPNMNGASQRPALARSFTSRF